VAIAVNLIVTFVVSAIVRATRARELPDETQPDDYIVEAGEEGVEPLPASPVEAEKEGVPSGR
jgi:hypothetical protein